MCRNCQKVYKNFSLHLRNTESCSNEYTRNEIKQIQIIDRLFVQALNLKRQRKLQEDGYYWSRAQDVPKILITGIKVDDLELKHRTNKNKIELLYKAAKIKNKHFHDIITDRIRAYDDMFYISFRRVKRMLELGQQPLHTDQYKMIENIYEKWDDLKDTIEYIVANKF